MIVILAWSVSGVLALVSGIHLYWLFGGRRGHKAAVPERNGEPLFRPSRLATAVVALLLGAAAWAVLELGGASRPGLLSGKLLAYGGWLLAAVFVLRAIGDFKWLGLFKKETGTLFAKWDSMLYTPLCLLLGLAVMTIAIWRIV